MGCFILRVSHDECRLNVDDPDFWSKVQLNAHQDDTADVLLRQLLDGSATQSLATRKTFFENLAVLLDRSDPPPTPFPLHPFVLSHRILILWM